MQVNMAIPIIALNGKSSMKTNMFIQSFSLTMRYSKKQRQFKLRSLSTYIANVITKDATIRKNTGSIARAMRVIITYTTLVQRLSLLR